MQNIIKMTMLAACLTAAGYVCAAGPVVVNDAWVKANGSKVTGAWTGTLTQAAISVRTKLPLTIENAILTGPANLIDIAAGSNVSVLNTTGSVTNPNVYNTQKGAFVTASSPASLLVKNCTVTGAHFGVYVAGFSGGSGQTIQIIRNVFNNIDGRFSNGKGGYITSGVKGDPRAHAIQLNGVQARPNIDISWNQVIVKPFEGEVNDVINIYSSSGTSQNHLKVHDNYIQGALPTVPGVDRYAGGGIITDGKSTDTAATATAWVDIYNNQVVMTANYGVAVAAGHDNNIFNNRVVSAGKLSNGTIYTMTFANAANNGNLQKQTTTTYFNNHVHNNVLGLIRKDISGNPVRSDWWLPGQNNNAENNIHLIPVSNTSPTLQDEAAEFASWQKKLVANNVQIGVQQGGGSGGGTGTGTLTVSKYAGSDVQCDAAVDTLYLDGSTSGKTFTVSSGLSQIVSAGSHTLVLASGGTAVPAGGTLSGTCRSTLSASSAAVTADKTTAVNAVYRYTAAATGMACVVTSSRVTGLQYWDNVVDQFSVIISLTGMPVGTDGNIQLSGSLTMKNLFKAAFWNNKGLQTAFAGDTGTFAGAVYAPNGILTLNLEGYLADGSPVHLNLGDNPLKSVTLNGVLCVAAFRFSGSASALQLQ